MGSGKGYLYGTMILGIGTAVVKLIGAFFKIPLTNILGGVGMSYFNVAYDLYYPLCALFVSGVPVAVSKLVSESMARGRVKNARKLLRVALCAFITLGTAAALAMFFGAEWFSNLIKNPEAKAAVMMLAPSLLAGCVMACFRGYWQGQQDMTPTAVSQVVEALSKLVFGLIFAYTATAAGLGEFASSGTVFGAVCVSEDQARLAVLPFAAAGAVLGVTVSSFCGVLYLLLRHKLGKNPVTKAMWRASPPAEPGRRLIRQLFQIALPVCLASVISNMTTFIDLISVMNRLSSAIRRGGETILSMYAGAIPGGLGMDRLASYLYGCYSGLAVPLYNLVPSVTAVIGVSLLPAVSAARALGNRRQMSSTIESSLRVSALLAFPAGLGICALAEPVLRLLYFSKPMEVTVIAPALRLMGVSAIFVALTLPVNAALQALGHAGLPVKLLLLGGLLKLGCNYLLVGIPRLNIQAAPVGTMACYLFVLCASLCALLDLVKAELSVTATFGKPLIAGLGCALAASQAQKLLTRALTPGMATMLSIGIGGLVFVFLVFSLKILKKEDIFMLPGGEKFAKLLENHHLLG